MKGERLRLATILGFLFSLAMPLIGCYALNPYILLPNDIYTIPPSPDLPKELAAFSGKWMGQWVGSSGSPEAILVVEEIGEKEAKVFYTVRMRNGMLRSYNIDAKIISGKLPTLEFSARGDTISFQMNEDFKSLRGEYEHIGKHRRIGIVTMTHID